MKRWPPSALTPLIGLVLAWTCACPPPSLKGPEAVRAIRTYFPHDAELSYVFTLQKASGRVRITLVVTGAREGRTSLAVNERWSGFDDVGAEVENLRAYDESGRGLPVSHPEDHRWVIEHGPEQLLLVHYDLVPLDRPLDLESHERNYHRPLLRDGLFHLIGNLGLLIPEHLWTVDKHKICLRWLGFGDAGWQVVSSYSSDQAGFCTSRTLEEFRHGLFVAGRLRLHTRKVRGGTVAVSMSGEAWDFQDRSFVDLAVRVVEAERNFFADTDPFFLISLIPVGQKIKGLRAMGGMGLTSSFALFMSPGIRLDQPRDAILVKRLLAHELFHNWNGSRIVVAQPETLHYWFSEGFTNHYTRKMLHQAGLLSPEETIEDLNETLAAYTFSPVREAPNRRIGEEFWSNPAVHELPYLRGDLVAMLVDHEIRTRSRGRRSLDDLMRALLRQAMSKPQAFDNPALFARIGEFTSPAFSERIRRIIVEGTAIELPRDLYAPCLAMSRESLGPFDLGFDFATSRERRQVVGVRRGSRAHAAGLRDGQELLGWKVEENRIKKPVKLIVRDGPGRKTLTYLPQGKPRPVPQFTPGRSKRACRNLL